MIVADFRFHYSSSSFKYTYHSLIDKARSINTEIFTFKLKKKLKTTTKNAFLKFRQPSYSLARCCKSNCFIKRCKFSKSFLVIYQKFTKIKHFDNNKKIPDFVLLKP